MKAGWWILLAGVGILAIAIVMVINTRAFLARAISTKGRVIAIEARESRDSDDNYTTSHYPVIEFKNSRGKVIQFTSKLGRNPPAFKIGQEVKVLYDPQVANSAKIETFVEIWLLPVVFGFFGIVFSVIGVISIFYP